MKGLIGKIKFLFVFSVLLLIFMGIEVKASSLSVSTSKSSVSAEESFTVTVSVSDGAGYVTTSVSNGSGGGTTEWIDNSSYSFTCTAGSSGTVTISATGTIADYTTEIDESKSASASVSISSSNSSSDDTSSSSENSTSTSGSDTSSTSAPTLYTLGITPYDFTGFKSNVTSYSVTVPNDCTSVSIYAKSNTGTVSGTGTVTLSEGTNKYTVTVSNSNGSTTYTLSIIRETLDGDDVANSIEGDETEETDSEGIGLAGLSITGYELDPEFDISIYEYTVIVEDELTLEFLEELKEKITAITNADTVYTEITAEITEDEIATITIVVKDDEKEYATYVIYFEEELEVTSVVGTTAVSSDSNELIDMEYFTKRVYLIMGCLAICVVIALYYAIASYKKSKYIEKYIMNNYEEEEEEEDFESLVQDFKENELSKKDEDSYDEKIPELVTGSDKELEPDNDNNNKDFELEEDENKLKDSREYKKPRRSFNLGGKH